MKPLTILITAFVLGAKTVLANDPIPGIAFRERNGIAAAEAAAPMWYLPRGTCMPSAAEDGYGNQTRGVNTDNCNIFKLDHNCPEPPRLTGMNTLYANITGEPFYQIPTYWAVQDCDDVWKIIYYMYFKKDTGHKHDWEGIVVSFRNTNRDNWIRDTVKMEQDGNHREVHWDDLNDTFDGQDDWQEFEQKGHNHGKFYFGKFHHSVHYDWHTNDFKDTCPAMSISDYRNADYYFWAKNHLRHISVLDPTWDWGRASNPATMDICEY